ncbi:MAG: ribosome maturation factor RimP [Cyclobacteriaceae bacterium]
MEKLEQEIRDIIEEFIQENPELFLVDVLLKGNIGNQKLLIFIDGDNGVSIDHCSKLSRRVGAVLEEKELIEGKYFLEVSSPGLDHPIKLIRQYHRNVDRRLEVEGKDGNKIIGKLVKVDGDQIILETDDKTNNQLVMSFNEIIQSKIEVSFK